MAPLPDVAAATPILKSLGVTARIGPGWSLIALALATIALTNRPGRHITFDRPAGSLVIRTRGGTRLDHTATKPKDLTNSLANLLTATTCELCGRPGRLHPWPAPTILCDACAFLIENPGHRLPFQPRLPLVESARNAAHELEGSPGLDDLPAGWAQRVLMVFSYLRGLDPAGSLTVEDQRTFLHVQFDADADETVLRLLRVLLMTGTAASCRHCGRTLPRKRPHLGQCDGCIELGEFGDETVPIEVGWFADGWRAE
ncbi:hypothetical protein ACFQ9V_13265 [Leifsonia sp. NPDC056665]|uniref:hypothetical protein n=1 Tax=Leifsonia sp. NPDC056665 TaxID=3345901 RepID=UPI0036A08A10